MPSVDPALDACVECGYCEPVCPTADVTTTPRQRIALQREIALAAAAGDDERRRELEGDYAYAAVDSCAADSLCVTACPVTIDTGAVMKRLRGERHSPLAQHAGRVAARHWATAVKGVRIGLGAAHAVPAPLTGAASKMMRRLGATDLVPAWSPDIPRGGGPRPAARHVPAARAVFFAACIGSVFASEEGDGPDRGTSGRGGSGGRASGSAGAFLSLCERAASPSTSPNWRGCAAALPGSPRATPRATGRWPPGRSTPCGRPATTDGCPSSATPPPAPTAWANSPRRCPRPSATGTPNCASWTA
ncbi:4Fe-4S dicluster domain-containing protein [Streptomyces kaempferi]